MATFLNHHRTKQELLQHVGHPNQIAGIKPVEVADGPERGNRLLQVHTGSGLTFDVTADRALDIAACRYKGMSLVWLSAGGSTNPAYFDPAGLGWLRSFGGGLLATCGLDHFGPPVDDNGESLGLHGRISNLPAHAVSYRTDWVGDDYVLEVSGQVRQTRVFGENLLLKRRISTALGSNKIRIEDEVVNEGFDPQPHMLLYHFNLGFPLISAETRLRIDGAETVARDADAEAGLDAWSRMQPPTAGYREQVFRHTLPADAGGLARVTVENPALGLALRFTYRPEELPHLFQWKMMGQGTYVLGIEPANCGVLLGRVAAGAQNDLPVLNAGETRRYTLELEIIEKSSR